MKGMPSQLKPVTLGDSNEVRVGQLAITIGNPFGQEFTTTTGIVSAIGRTIRAGNSDFSLPKVIQTDAPMNPGNSGGPLLDRKGQVIGVDAQIITRSGANTGIGFAIPANIAKQVVPVLISEGSFTYSWLGVRGTTVTPEAVDLMGAPGRHTWRSSDCARKGWTGSYWRLDRKHQIQADTARQHQVWRRRNNGNQRPACTWNDRPDRLPAGKYEAR